MSRSEAIRARWPTSLREGPPERTQARSLNGRRDPGGGVAAWIEPLDEDGPPDRELRLGFDTGARLLETVVLVFDSGDEMVIHAMPARRKYLDLLP